MVLHTLLLSFLISRLSYGISVSMIPNTGTPPSYRELPGFTHDPDHDKLYVYGGIKDSYLDDLWEFDLKSNTWNEIFYVTTISPGPRSNPQLVFFKDIKDGKDKILLFGGDSVRGPLSDLWEFDIENETVMYIQWKMIEGTNEPPPRAYYRAAYSYTHNGKKYLAVYGGQSKKSWVNTIFM
jgi:hypothetical protein